MPTYVAAVDFSKCSRQALDVAIARAQADNAELLMVHAFNAGFRLAMVYQDGAIDPLLQLEQEMKLDEAIELTTKWAQPAREGGLSVEVIAREDDAARLVLDVAAERKADLIIVGREGHRTLHNFFIGSTADTIVKKSKCPVLVVPMRDLPESI